MSNGIQTPSELQTTNPIGESPETDGRSSERVTTSDLLGLGMGELNLEDGDRCTNGKPGERVDLMD